MPAGASPIPLLWTLALGGAAPLFHGRAPSLAEAPQHAAAFVLALGFWALFFAAARGLYRATPLTLLLTGPLLLAMLALAAAQESHRALYGVVFDPERVRLARANWEVVTTGVLGFLGEARAALAAGGLALLLAFGVALRRSRGSVYRPLRGAGGAHALASLLWLAWWLAPPLHAAVEPASPVLGAQVLVRDVREALWKGPREEGQGRAGWKPARTGVRAVRVPPAGPRPDVVLILLESVRADHLSVYGHARETSPHLRAWAARPDVLVFQHAFSNATVSYLALVSLSSGLDLRRPLEAYSEAPLLWDRLAARGYATCFVTISTGYWRYRLDRFLATPGLGRYRDLGQEQLAATPRVRPADLRGRLLRAVLGEASSRSLAIDRDDARGRAAFGECLAQRDPARPFFGVWELEGTHFPYRYPDAFRAFEPASGYAISRDDPRPLANAYDNAILAADHQIGAFLDGLEASGAAERTIVIVTSDHGEAFWEHGEVFHGTGLHPEQSRVPLLVRIPEALRRRYPPAAFDALAGNRGQAVQLADLAPTLEALADASLAAAVPAETDGANLLRPLPADREIHLMNRSPFAREPSRAPHSRGVVRGGVLEIVSATGARSGSALAGLGPQPPLAGAAAGGNTRIPPSSQ